MNGFKTTTVDTASQAIAETGKQAVQDFINIYTDPQMPGPTIPDTTIIPPVPYRPTPELAALPVGILGAGVSGLYTAMILDSLYVWNILRHLYHPQRRFSTGVSSTKSWNPPIELGDDFLLTTSPKIPDNINTTFVDLFPILLSNFIDFDLPSSSSLGCWSDEVP